MKQFEIRKQNGAGDLVANVRAETYTQAGERAAKKLFGPNTTACRVTGETGYSGCYQAYQSVGGGTLSSTGYQFHVREE